jgi:predicted dehydrogenase
MQNGVVQIGILGCGRIARTRHIPEIAANPKARLAGFYNRTLPVAEELAAGLGGRAYATPEELLADPFIDAVLVLTPNNSHAEFATAALRAGKHVLCEKPMAVTLEECERLVEEERASSRILMIAQNQRFHAAHVKARELIVSGAIGSVLTVQTAFSHGGPSLDANSWFLSKSTGRLGVLGDLGVHKIDLIRFLTGQEFVAISAVVDTLDQKRGDGGRIELDDNAACLFRLSGGAIGTMTVSWTSYGKPDISTRIGGTLGTIELFRRFEDPLVLYRPGTEPEQIAVESNTSSGVVDAFIGAIVSGAPSPVSAASVLPSMRALFAAYESGRTGGNMIRLD